MSPSEAVSIIEAIGALFGVITVAFSGAVAWAWNQHEKAIQKLETRLVEAEVRRTNQDEKCEAETNELRQKIEARDATISDLRTRIAALEAEVKRKISPAFPMPAVRPGDQGKKGPHR